MHYNIRNRQDDTVESVPQAIAQASVNILKESQAKGIVVFTVSGSTAKLISKQRPAQAIYSFTPSDKTYNRQSLFWGIFPYRISNIDGANKLISASETILMEQNVATRDELIVIVIGQGLQEGTTNVIKIHKVGCENE